MADGLRSDTPMVGHQLPSPGNTLASNPNLASQSQALTGNFSKSHAFDFKHGSAIERSQDDRESVTHASPAIKLMAPPAAKVIRGHSPYGNFLADEPDEGKVVKSMSNLSTTKQTTGQMTQQASAENSWLTDGGGRESSLSMVSDYTLSYGTDALEAERLVHNADGRFVPAYVALDRKVLRFHAFFRDPRGAPGFKVRKATILHYLEDGSTRVSEKRVENSGIVTGEICRRHRVPKTGGGFYSLEDFDVGNDIEVFGRAYTIQDMDDFTREFYDLNAMPRAEATPMPDDFAEPESRPLPAAVNSYPDVVFQSQGVSDRFLGLDKKVLRFYCSWKDQKAFGEVCSLSPCCSLAGIPARSMYRIDALHTQTQELLFVLHYFLVDDTAEVIDLHERNDGRDHWGAYIKRRPLLKGLPRQVNRGKVECVRGCG